MNVKSYNILLALGLVTVLSGCFGDKKEEKAAEEPAATTESMSHENEPAATHEEAPAESAPAPQEDTPAEPSAEEAPKAEEKN